jgi:hypothetical protein
MAFDPAFLELMPSTLRVAGLESFNDYGEPSYSTSSASYRCLIEQKPTVVRNSLGEEVVAMYTAYVASTSPLSATDLYILPNGDEPSVQNIAIYYDEDGIHHNVVYLGGGQGG